MRKAYISYRQACLDLCEFATTNRTIIDQFIKLTQVYNTCREKVRTSIRSEGQKRKVGPFISYFQRRTSVDIPRLLRDNPQILLAPGVISSVEFDKLIDAANDMSFEIEEYITFGSTLCIRGPKELELKWPGEEEI